MQIQSLGFLLPILMHRTGAVSCLTSFFGVSASKGAQYAVRGVASVLLLHKESRFVDLRWFSVSVAPIVWSWCTVMHVSLRMPALLANEMSVRIAILFLCWLAVSKTMVDHLQERDSTSSTG